MHKISFIAQDMTDNRAFGYVYGSPENGHRFFGIKTEKAAGQVVVAMRDLFQVVFEMKKKEIDEAKQNMGSTTATENLMNVSLKSSEDHILNLSVAEHEQCWQRSFIPSGHGRSSCSSWSITSCHSCSC